MKVALSAAVLLALVACGHCISENITERQCCPGELVLPRGSCTNATERINLGCEAHFMLKDIIVESDGLSTRDTPGYIFTVDKNKYCVGEMSNSTDQLNKTLLIKVAVVCFEKEDDAIQREQDIRVNGILALVSSVFLVLTLAVYMLLPQLRDLQGKCIMCMSGSMALGYFTLGIMQLGVSNYQAVCDLNGFLIYFWLMATFFWMNVVSINVLRSAIQPSYLKKTEMMQFMYYSLYGWGFPVGLLLLTLITNYVEGDHIRPGIGVNSCWFQGPRETWVFFYGPMAILVTANVFLFVLTSLQLWNTAKNHQYQVSTLNRLKYKFVLCLKLFIVMGLSWIFEIASFAHGESHIVWRIADVFNCLQGLVVFLLLVVFRRRALHGLAERGVGGAVARKLVQRLYKNGEDIESMIESEQEPEIDGAPYNVNLKEEYSAADVPTSTAPYNVNLKEQYPAVSNAATAPYANL